ncbi:MAG: hypothetical protein LBT09_08960 [Planctomycetaceae bacterium]|nr:hypothetical protein [Planctomycetaceae bacterium]
MPTSLTSYQPDSYLNNDQPAQPPGGRIAYQRMIFRIDNKPMRAGRPRSC